MASLGRSIIAGALLLAVVASAGCGPATRVEQRIGGLPEPLQSVLRQAVWAHGNPYVWSEKKTVLLDTSWNDYLHGRQPTVSRKLYAIDLESRRMRIDDLTAQSVALYDGSAWRVFIQGQEIKKPDRVTADTAPYLAMFDYAASEMRAVRLLFGLPFSLLDDGVRLKSLGRVESASGSTVWDVVEARFDYATTGFLTTDRVMIYFDPRSDRVSQVFLRLSGDPFYSMPFWGEWAEYRRLSDGLLVARRWEFRRTDAQGEADKGRRLSISLDKVAFNQPLPGNLFSSPKVAMPTVVDQGEEPPAKRIGRDVIDESAK